MTSQNTVSLMMDALELAADDIRDILTFGRQDPESVRRILLQSKLQDIELRMTQLGTQYHDMVREGVESTSRDVTRAYQQATREVAAANGRTVIASFAQTPTEVLRLYAARIDEYGLKISGDVWARAQMNPIQRRVMAGIARGQSANSLARDVEEYLVGGRRGAKGSRIAYQAKRLARTEINNAYWESTTVSAHQSRVVSAQMWQLSGRHKVWDMCDLFAGSDNYQLGSGVYPAGNTPSKPHPQCLCYLVDVLREPEEWMQPKPAPGTPRIRIDRSALPENLRNRVSETFTPRELQQAVQGLNRAQRGHLTENFVRRQAQALRVGTRAGAESVIGTAAA